MAQVEVDRIAEQQQLHHRNADDHRQRDAVAAQLAQLLEHDRPQPAQVHAAGSRPRPRVAATNTSSRFGATASICACGSAPAKARCSADISAASSLHIRPARGRPGVAAKR
ncbi:hypothetical protein G6F56_014023 [Rhizopus delemar]|nr:hypothetical protein G6F56_014023 [Rhizopus delemar]